MRRNRFTFSVMALLLLGVPAWGQQQSNDSKSKPLPTKFNLRHHRRRNPRQGARGRYACWVHGTMAAIESNLILPGVWKSAGLDGFPAISEYHLDWWNGFNRHKNNDLADPSQDKTGLVVHNGGDFRVSATR